MTDHNLENSPEMNALPSSTSPELDGDDSAAFIKRMEKIFLFSETRSNQLNQLYLTDPNNFSAALDDLVYEMADDDPDYQAALAKLKQTRSSGSDERPLVLSLKEMMTKFRQILTSEAGIPDEAALNQIEQAKANVSALILEKSQGQAITNPIEVLEMLGIVTTDQNDQPVYKFPYDLMPAPVIEKWKIYLAAACRHMQLKDAIDGRNGQAEVKQADTTRRFAHDSVTKDVHAILNLDDRFGWENQNTREMLGLIRDHELPTQESATDQAAQLFVKRHKQGISAAKSLSHPSDHHD